MYEVAYWMPNNEDDMVYERYETRASAIKEAVSLSIDGYESRVYDIEANEDIFSGSRYMN